MHVKRKENPANQKERMAMDIERVKALCYENEYNDGKYHMLWMDKNDVSCEEEYDTKEEMIEHYNELWSEGAWDFTWIDTKGHEFYPWAAH